MMKYDAVWFREAQKDEALALVRHLPSDEIARRELWPSHGLRFWLSVPIPDAQGALTDVDGICVQPNLYGSESLGPGLIETREGGGRYLKLARFAKLEAVGGGIVVATWENGLLETPEFLKAARAGLENEESALAAVRETRETLAREKIEAAAPVILRWARTVGIMAGVPDPASLDAEDAVELYEMLNLSARGLASIQDYATAKGIIATAPAAPSMSDYDPLEEAKHSYGKFILPDKIKTKRVGG